MVMKIIPHHNTTDDLGCHFRLKPKLKAPYSNDHVDSTQTTTTKRYILSTLATVKRTMLDTKPCYKNRKNKTWLGFYLLTVLLNISIFLCTCTYIYQ